MLLGKLFATIVPLGNIAYRVNVMSAFFAACAVALLFEVLQVQRLGSDPFMHLETGNSAKVDLTPAVHTVLCVLFAISPAVVALARVAEMYTLSTFWRQRSSIFFCRIILADPPMPR